MDDWLESVYPEEAWPQASRERPEMIFQPGTRSGYCTSEIALSTDTGSGDDWSGDIRSESDFLTLERESVRLQQGIEKPGRSRSDRFRIPIGANHHTRIPGGIKQRRHSYRFPPAQKEMTACASRAVQTKDVPPMVVLEAEVSNPPLEREVLPTVPPAQSLSRRIIRLAILGMTDT